MTTIASSNDLYTQRIAPGMRVFGQIISVEPLALIVSLPNQLLAHVPVTNITSQLTKLLENMDEDVSMESEESDDDEAGPSRRAHVPELFEIFHPGQYVRSVVNAVHAAGSTDVLGLGKARDDSHKAIRRVELSLIPEKVNAGVVKADLKPGFVSCIRTFNYETFTYHRRQTLSAAVKSVEDHGYILDFGIGEVSGFLSFNDAPSTTRKQLQVGHLIDVSVLKLSSNGRTCNVTSNDESLRNSVVRLLWAENLYYFSHLSALGGFKRQVNIAWRTCTRPHNDGTAKWDQSPNSRVLCRHHRRVPSESWVYRG